MGNKKFIAIIAGLVTLGAWASIYLSVCGFPPRLDARPHEALGNVVAEEALKLRAPGGRIMLVCRDTARFKNPASVAQLRGFHAVLKAAGAAVASTNSIKIDPLRLMAVPGLDYLQILKAVSDTDVIVSFLGPPVLNPDQTARLTEKRPKIVAVCSGAMPSQVNLKRIFDEKLLHVAVISRPDASTNAPPSDAPRSWFDHLYTLVTPANLSELPAPVSTRQ